MADYANAAAQAASFAEEDAFNATMFMTDAEQKFGAAQTATVALVGAMATVANARNQTLTALMHDRLITLAIGTTLAVLPSLAASTWLGPGGTPGLTFQQDPGMLARIDAALRHVESPGLRKAA